MSDNEKYNDEEYHFIDDPDMSSMGHEQESAASDTEVNSETSSKNRFDINELMTSVQPVLDKIKNNFALRIGLMVMAVLFLVVMIYRCTSNPIAHKNDKVDRSLSAQRMTTPTIKPMVQNVTSNTDGQSDRVGRVNQRLASLDQEQTQIQAQLSAATNQLSGLNTNVTAMMDNLKIVSDQVSQLAIAIQEQQKMTTALDTRLMQQTIKKTMPRHINKMVENRTVQYFLQAVIPGRAWLINTNGDALTVREGTKVANYGVVRYIDAKRGRVLTSSGHIIKFNQEDS